MNEPMLKKAMDTLEFLSQDAATRMEYEARMKYLRDEASRMNGAKAEGIAEGLATGEHKKAVEVAKNMLRIGLEVKIISQVSGLSEQEILKL